MSYRKKLIEVSLPLNAINKAASTEKSIRHGHPSTLHLWWARRPLATCRAVLFASLIDDPSEHPEQFPTEEEQDRERVRLFKLMEEMVEWKNIHDANLMQKVRAEILQATNGNPPPVLDPFAGGGSIPLEAQRLGLEAHASDLNPVAVLINKALIEIPPKFANRPPVNPGNRSLFASQKNDWQGAHGLAADIRYYGQWMRDEAEKRIGHLYPKAKLPDGSEATVIAWIWARTVKCNNPACGAQMPLAHSFALSTKRGKEAWIEPIIDQTTMPPTINFAIKTGHGRPQDGTVNRQGAKCIACGTTVPFDYVRNEGRDGHMGAQLMAIVAEGTRERTFLAPDIFHTMLAAQAEPVSEVPVTDLPEKALSFRVQGYGMTQHRDLFTSRQLLTLTTFSDLVKEARQKVFADAYNLENGVLLSDREVKSNAYSDAIATYLAFAVDKMTTTNTSMCAWQTDPTRLVTAFGRQSMPMVWDFAEANPFSGAAGDYNLAVGSLTEVLDRLVSACAGEVHQMDATSSKIINNYLVSTDPPYYDNIGYADLSDFFYVWLRRTLIQIYPELFGTVLVPKAQELIATPYRFDGSKAKARNFFEDGLNRVFTNLRSCQLNDYPFTLYYAFKQAESEIDSGDTVDGEKFEAHASTGWETMLEGLIKAGFAITGTWPMRTELIGNLKKNIGALASSIVLVCRPRPADAPLATRSDFLRALRKELPEALRKLQHGSIAPVDLAQASIGPGMSIYSRYRQVVESDGTPLRVRTALQMINQELDAALTEQEGEYDNETRWAIAWFEQTGMQEGLFGSAETLSKARNVSVSALEKSGLVEAKAGKVRLRRREELNSAWEARESSVWELTQRLIYTLLDDQGELGKQGGEIGAANLLRPALHLSESVRDLAYRLYALCERKGWAQEALAYNSLITSWTRLTDLAHRRTAEIQQGQLL